MVDRKYHFTFKKFMLVYELFAFEIFAHPSRHLCIYMPNKKNFSFQATITLINFPYHLPILILAAPEVVALGTMEAVEIKEGIRDTVGAAVEVPKAMETLAEIKVKLSSIFHMHNSTKNNF